METKIFKKVLDIFAGDKGIYSSNGVSAFIDVNDVNQIAEFTGNLKKFVEEMYNTRKVAKAIVKSLKRNDFRRAIELAQEYDSLGYLSTNTSEIQEVADTYLGYVPTFTEKAIYDYITGYRVIRLVNTLGLVDHYIKEDDEYNALRELKNLVTEEEELSAVVFSYFVMAYIKESTNVVTLGEMLSKLLYTEDTYDKFIGSLISAYNSIVSKNVNLQGYYEEWDLAEEEVDAGGDDDDYEEEDLYCDDDDYEEEEGDDDDDEEDDDDEGELIEDGLVDLIFEDEPVDEEEERLGHMLSEKVIELEHTFYKLLKNSKDKSKVTLNLLSDNRMTEDIKEALLHNDIKYMIRALSLLEMGYKTNYIGEGTDKKETRLDSKMDKPQKFNFHFSNDIVEVVIEGKAYLTDEDTSYIITNWKEVPCANL